MIRYSLSCDQDHRFEAWFSGSEAFDRQRADGHVVCPICGSVKVEKTLMAPSVSTARKKNARESREETPAAGRRARSGGIGKGAAG